MLDRDIFSNGQCDVVIYNTATELISAIPIPTYARLDLKPPPPLPPLSSFHPFPVVIKLPPHLDGNESAKNIAYAKPKTRFKSAPRDTTVYRYVGSGFLEIFILPHRLISLSELCIIQLYNKSIFGVGNANCYIVDSFSNCLQSHNNTVSSQQVPITNHPSVAYVHKTKSKPAFSEFTKNIGYGFQR